MRTELRQPYKQFFGTLANQCRLDIIDALRSGEKNVGEICRIVGDSQPTVSRNLQRLECCGFVSVQPNGRERVYALNETTTKQILALMHQHMDRYCKKVVEGKHGKV